LGFLIFKSQAMKNCETCKHWSDKEVPYNKVVRECNNKKINDDYYNDEPDGLYYSYQEGGYFLTGPKFGCVHHEESK